MLRRNQSFFLLSCISLLLNVLLVVYQFENLGNERIMLVPPNITKTFWVDGQHVSPEYLSEMGLFFCYLRLNATPSNVDQQHQVLLRYIYPNFYSEIKSILEQEEERIKSFHIAMNFFPTNVEVNENNWFVRITGDLQSTIGEEKQEPRHISYQIGFHYDAGRLLVKSFEEVKKDA